MAEVGYMTSVNPWGTGDGDGVSKSLDNVFGSGNWDYIGSYTLPDLTQYEFLYIDGSDGNNSAFDSFMAANKAALEAWVSSGGVLFINAARWSYGDLDLGFGITMHTDYSATGYAVDASHAIFDNDGLNGDDTGLSWNGNWFSHDSLTGTMSSIIVDSDGDTILGDKDWGSGHVMFGGITADFFHYPDGGGNVWGPGDAPAHLLDNIFEYAASFMNSPPVAVDDDLTGGSGPMQVGYYDMWLGQGNATQVEAILAAGHIPVMITDLSAAELAGIDMLLVQNPDNGGYNGEYLAQLATINSAVAAGLTLIIHDRYVQNAESILPGSGGFNIIRSFTEGTSIDFIDDAHSVASGPGGALTDASLDGGNFSNHGFAIQGSLPAGADLILSTNDASHIVTFSYGHGAGHVIYSSIPIDFYLGGDTVGGGANNMAGRAEEYMTNLIDYAAVDLDHALTDEDTAVSIDGADLLANDSDPDSDTLTISGVSALSNLGAAVVLNGDGTISYDPTGALDYLAEGEVVEDTFTYTVDDGNGGTDTATVTLKVLGINDGPTAPVDGDGPSGASISEHHIVGTAIGLDADSTDPEGDTINYYFRDGGGNAVQTLGKFTIDAATGVVTLAAAVNFEMQTNYSLTIYASDGSAESSSLFAVDVTNVVEHLFTPGNDGTAADPIDFNALPDGAYDFDGAQYDALAGDDFVILPNLATVDAGNPWNYNVTFVAGAGNDVIQGGDGNDIVSGGDGNDKLYGATGDDRLVGSAGDDILAGGDGSDKLTGSSGRDIFIFTDSEVGTTKLGEHDVITDFQQGTDKIDISALYDNGVSYAGLKSGALNGTAGSFNKAAFYSASGKTWLEGDVTGDGVADWVIEMSGSYKLKGTDLIVSNSVITSQATWNADYPALDYTAHHQDYYLV